MKYAQKEEVRVASGCVEATKQNQPDRYGLKVNGEWFNGWGLVPAEKGANVTIRYREKEGFKNIVSIDVPVKLSDTVPGAFRPSERDRMVAYCVGVKAAANLHAGSDVEKAWTHFFEEAEAIAEWLLKKMAQPKKAEAKAEGVSK